MLTTLTTLSTHFPATNIPTSSDLSSPLIQNSLYLLSLAPQNLQPVPFHHVSWMPAISSFLSDNASTTSLALPVSEHPSTRLCCVPAGFLNSCLLRHVGVPTGWYPNIISLFAIFRILWCKMKITQASAPTIRMDCHPILTNWCPHLCHPHHFYAGCSSWFNPPNLSWLGTGTKYAGLHTWWLGSYPVAVREHPKDKQHWPLMCKFIFIVAYRLLLLLDLSEIAVSWSVLVWEGLAIFVFTGTGWGRENVAALCNTWIYCPLGKFWCVCWIMAWNWTHLLPRTVPWEHFWIFTSCLCEEKTNRELTSAGLQPVTCEIRLFVAQSCIFNHFLKMNKTAMHHKLCHGTPCLKDTPSLGACHCLGQNAPTCFMQLGH